MINEQTPRQLYSKLTLYFAFMLGTIIAVGVVSPEIMNYMPFGGRDALEAAGLSSGRVSIVDQMTTILPEAGNEPITLVQLGRLALFLSFSLGGTMLVMLPIAWTYAAVMRGTGFRQSFARTLIVLPICATTIVVMIQNNLALAFGLAAMVAAVRFRISLREPIDGIFIFSAICVGLAAGIGYLGVAIFMAAFFCFANGVMWHIQFGRNPRDDARLAKREAET